VEVGMYIKPELFDFFRDLKNNNNRDWFQSNKHRYEKDVKEPLFAFIEDFADRLLSISPHYQAIPRINGGSFFRIYRDLRFSKDKTPYKTGAALHFRHESAHDVHAPGLYLHLEPEDVFVGCGIWKPGSDSLSRIRNRIAEHPGIWMNAINDEKFKTTYKLGGESLIRPPKGYDSDHPLIDDLKRKDYLASVQLTEAEVCEPDFLDRYVELCQISIPFMRFLTESIGLPW
jgi:uncharacterized protein (TIGR02453 family)